MSIAVWPPSLRKPTRSDYQSLRQDNRLKKRSGGAPGYRRKYSSAATQVVLMVNMSRADKAVFDAFYDDVTVNGTLPFYMPDPVTDGWALLTNAGQPVLNGDGSPILLSGQWLCLFGDEPPVETLVGVRFNISFSVWVMP